MRGSLTDILAELKSRLKALYGDSLKQLILYGSRARGDALPDSDIDVMAVVDDYATAKRLHEEELDIVVDLSARHNCVISLLHLTPERYATAMMPLHINLRKEGVAL